MFSRPEVTPDPAGSSADSRFWHCVQLYEQDSFLAETVAAYAADGIFAGEAVLIVATDANRAFFESGIAALGVDLTAAQASGQLMLLSAERMLTEFMVANWPDREMFRSQAVPLLRSLAAGPWKAIRAFGEMVGVLWENGNPAAALRLEELWDELAATERFSLLCAYSVESFKGASHAEGFLCVCDRHSIVLPSESYLRLESDRERLRFVARLQQQACPQPPRRDANELLEAAFRHGDKGGLVAAIAICVEAEVENRRTLPDIVRRLECNSGLLGSVAQTAPGEFLAVAGGLSGYGAVEELARWVRASVSGSIGVAFSPPEASDPRELRQNAETALWHARRSGGGQMEFYSTGLGKSAHLHRRLESGLRKALRLGEFELYFQPEVRFSDVRTTRYEALLRWFPRPDCAVPPSVFIPVAEESGLILQIGEWALRQACLRAASWQEGSRKGVGVGVNVSALQFGRKDFADLVGRVLEETGLAPGLLELELTESMLIRDFEQSKATLLQLRNLGVTVAIDDFGTGYSSLGYLQSLKIDALKIDRCFVAELDDSKPRSPVLRGLIGIARELGIRVVAEGVETERQYRALEALGCDEAQGFLLGHPDKVCLETVRHEAAQVIGDRRIGLPNSDPAGALIGYHPASDHRKAAVETGNAGIGLPDEALFAVIASRRVFPAAGLQ